MEGLASTVILAKLGPEGARRLDEIFVQIAPSLEEQHIDLSEQDMLLILDRVKAVS